MEKQKKKTMPLSRVSEEKGYNIAKTLDSCCLITQQSHCDPQPNITMVFEIRLTL